MKNDKNERTRKARQEKSTRSKKSIRSGILLIAVKTKPVNLTNWILVT